MLHNLRNLEPPDISTMQFPVSLLRFLVRRSNTPLYSIGLKYIEEGGSENLVDLEFFDELSMFSFISVRDKVWNLKGGKAMV